MSVNKVFDVDLDIKRPSSHRDFTVVNGDNGNRINVTLMDGDSPVDLTGCRIIAAFSRADGSIITVLFTVIRLKYAISSGIRKSSPPSFPIPLFLLMQTIISIGYTATGILPILP